MNPISHAARTNRSFNIPGMTVGRDPETGHMTFTRLHEKGTKTPRAAIASILKHAATWRHLPEHHAIYMWKIRQIKKHGTWV